MEPTLLEQVDELEICSCMKGLEEWLFQMTVISFMIQFQALFNSVSYLFFYLAYKFTVISIIYKWKTSV